MKTTEFVGGEVCTAAMDMEHPDTGDRLGGPLLVGYYPMSDGPSDSAAEVWIECEGKRIGVLAWHLKDLIKQLKRAQQLAVERRA